MRKNDLKQSVSFGDSWIEPKILENYIYQGKIWYYMLFNILKTYHVTFELKFLKPTWLIRLRSFELRLNSFFKRKTPLKLRFKEKS